MKQLFSAVHGTTVEILEPRVAPAGVVGFDYDSVIGKLTLTGDSAANEISIFPSGSGAHRVQGVDDTTFTGGASFLDIGKLTEVTFTGNVGSDRLRLFGLTGLKNLVFEGGSDIDVLELTDVRLQGDLDFSGGSGNDFVQLEGTFCIITGDLEVAGTGEVNLDFTAEKIAIGGSVIGSGGTGAFEITAEATHVSIGKGMRIEGGTGSEVLSLAPGGTLKIGKLATGESLWISGSDTFVTLGASNVKLAGGIRLDGTGPGQSHIRFSDTSVSIGKLPTGHSIYMSATSTVSRIEILGSNIFAVGGIEISGSGSSQISGDAPHSKITVGKLSTGQSLRVAGGAGDDTVSITTSSLTFSGGIEFRGGGGINTMELIAPHATAKIGKLTNGASVAFEGEASSDTLRFEVGNLSLAGGVDFDPGDGNNLIEFLGSGARVKVGKFADGASILFTGGTAQDTLHTDVANFQTLGGLSFTGASGQNQLTFSGAGGLVKIGKLNTGHSILFAGGSSTDTISSSRTTMVLTGGIEFNVGASPNSVFLQDMGSVRIGTLPGGESVRINGGGDSASLRITSNLITFKGGIVVNGSAAQESIMLDSPATTIGKTLEGASIFLDGQDGPDFITLDGGAFLAGSLILLGGGDSDFLKANTMQSLIVRGEVLLDGGSGNNQLDFEVDRLEVAKTLTFTGEGGRESATISANGFIAGNARFEFGFNLGAPEDVTIESRYNRLKGLTFRGELEIEMISLSGDTLTILNTVVAKDFSATLGTDVSTVTIDNFTVGGSFLLDTGGGADVVMFERGDFVGSSSIAKLATILTGAADDSVLIGSSATSAVGIFPDPSRVRFLGGLTLDGGSGTDTRNDIAVENDFPGAPATGLATFETVVM